MPRITPQIGRGIALGLGIGFLSWLFFLPIAGFHHIIACGILAPVVLNGETPQGSHLLWGEYDVRFFPGRFAVSFILWCFAVFLLFKLLYRRENER